MAIAARLKCRSRREQTCACPLRALTAAIRGTRSAARPFPQVPNRLQWHLHFHGQARADVRAHLYVWPLQEAQFLPAAAARNQRCGPTLLGVPRCVPRRHRGTLTLLMHAFLFSWTSYAPLLLLNFRNISGAFTLSKRCALKFCLFLVMANANETQEKRHGDDADYFCLMFHLRWAILDIF